MSRRQGLVPIALIALAALATIAAWWLVILWGEP